MCSFGKLSPKKVFLSSCVTDKKHNCNFKLQFIGNNYVFNDLKATQISKQ